MATRPDLDHGYVTVPQKELNGREIPYARGKGLGGTSIMNFMGTCSFYFVVERLRLIC